MARRAHSAATIGQNSLFGEEMLSLHPEKSHAPNGLVDALKSMFTRTTAMTRLEVFVPSWKPELPETLAKLFERMVEMDANIETAVVYGCDLSRGLTEDEEAALQDAWFMHEILFYNTLTR